MDIYDNRGDDNILNPMVKRFLLSRFDAYKIPQYEFDTLFYNDLLINIRKEKINNVLDDNSGKIKTT